MVVQEKEAEEEVSQGVSFVDGRELFVAAIMLLLL